MSRKKFWAFLKDENGAPIPSASIEWQLNSGATTTIYTTPVSAVGDELDQSTFTTDSDGFFEFYVGDSYETGNSVGYDADQLFKLVWTSVDGLRAGVVDDLQVFYQIFPVDETDSISTVKNKLASNELTYNWSTHAQQTWFHEVHQIEALDYMVDKNDGTFNKAVNNFQMLHLQNRLDSVKASGAESITIEASGAVARGFDIPSGSWIPTSGAGDDLYYYEIIHNFDTIYPLTQLWCTTLGCMQYPAKVEFRDSNTLRIFVPGKERDGKHAVVISDIGADYVYTDPDIELATQSLTMTPYLITPTVGISMSVATQSLSATMYSTSVSATSAATPEWIDDYFTTGLGTQWTESYQTSGSTDSSSVSGSIVITSGTEIIDSLGASASGIYQGPLTEDATYICKITAETATDDTDHRISFGIKFDDVNYIFGAATASSTVLRRMVSYQDGFINGDTGQSATVTYPLWFKIDRYSPAVRIWYSTNGTDWTSLVWIQTDFSSSSYPTYNVWVSVNDAGGGGVFTATIDEVYKE